ncbi:hypothetical protein L828_0643 [Mycobacteroides abscessus MAB_030201_1061]|nr:hypothetical protein L835_0621 [Mycobacteroides abscessus MAB_110811_1470]ETZ92263.1 hypothetical protein L828_0643 [Mycobacteroides abscessus MAB_030201_1061]
MIGCAEVLSMMCSRRVVAMLNHLGPRRTYGVRTARYLALLMF